MQRERSGKLQGKESVLLIDSMGLAIGTRALSLLHALTDRVLDIATLLSEK